MHSCYKKVASDTYNTSLKNNVRTKNKYIIQQTKQMNELILKLFVFVNEQQYRTHVDARF
jgi:hypothetical protein